jgi:cytochrome P450
MGNMRCIGDELAMIEMRLALLLISRELELEFDWDGWDKLQYVQHPHPTPFLLGIASSLLVSKVDT